MNRVVGWYCKGLEALIALGLAVMVVLVFGNVLMRYAFNSGITLSEELSRWIFVWITFLGAIVALREHGHLGTDMLVGRLPPAGRKACFALSGLLICRRTLSKRPRSFAVNSTLAAFRRG